tara:strand:+ start:1342 stop:1503 length:162 start_codon:yes stop_codon:yes gene_type:complete
MYEEFFNLKHYGGWSFTEIYSLPIALRRWFLQRLIDEYKREADEAKKANQKIK